MTSRSMNESTKSQPLLEGKVSKLRSALRHWQTLEIDYEGLKDEIQPLPDGTTSKAQLLDKAYDFEPEKLDDKDLNELFQVNGKVRQPSQIVDVLTKRVEYVRKNVESIRKQLTDLEKERNEVLLAGRGFSQSQSETELEPAEITEQLDDDGNVISSHVQRADDVKTNGSRKSASSTMQNGTDIHKDHPKHQPLQPINLQDTEEEAEVRQEMLQYGLPEVGNIVAELEMAEGDEEEDEDDDLDDLDDDYDDSEEDESEDEYGRSTRSSISDSYRRKMEKLQKEMGLSMENVGPTGTVASANRPTAAEAARKAAIARHEAAKSSPKNKTDESDGELSKGNPRKKVAFSGSLDIAKASPNQREGDGKKISKFKAARAAQPQTPLLPPPMGFPTTGSKSRDGPTGKIVSESLVERSRPPKEAEPAAPDDDDFDEELQKRQIALELHQLRNKKIHEQGGYIGGGELDNWGEEHVAPTIMDEKTGQPRKVSRFKAARLKGEVK